MKTAKKTLPLGLLALALLLGACSNNHKKSQNEDVSDAASDADFIVDSSGDLFFDDQFSFDANGDTAGAEVAMSDSENEPLIFDESMATHDYQANTNSADLSGEFSNYTFKQGDTLMWVAFSIYGDYRKWKELKEWNPEMKPSELGQGSVIRYKAPVNEFVWRPSGLPHLVKRGETLGTISNVHYGTMKRWKDIYNNNQPLIRDPNLIFAGFTLYYVPDRDLASE
jgi:nucleoid-associated protein YgaU